MVIWSESCGVAQAQERGHGFTGGDVGSSFSWAGDGWEEASWLRAPIQIGLCIFCARSAARRAGASFPQLRSAGISSFQTTTSKFLLILITLMYTHIYAWILFVHMWVYVSRARKMQLCIYIRVSFLICCLNTGVSVGNELLSCLLCKSAGCWGSYIHLYYFPCCVGHFTSKISIPVCFIEEPPLFLVIIGNNVVHWGRARGYRPGLRVFICLFYGLGWFLALFCASV